MMTIASVQAIPHFLFAGQSNMAGHADMIHLNMSMDILFNASTKTEILSDLKQRFYTYNETSKPPTSAERYDYMANYLVDLKDQGVLSTDIRHDHSSITCSLYTLQIMSDEDPAKAVAVDNLLSPHANCGEDFGPELMFGHVMEQLYYTNHAFAIEKIAAGGSEIKYHWAKDIGTFWDDLVIRVHDIDVANDDYWVAIV